MPRCYCCCALWGGAYSFSILARNFAIQNMVATAEMDYGINLELMAYSHARLRMGEAAIYCHSNNKKTETRKKKQETRNKEQRRR